MFTKAIRVTAVMALGLLLAAGVSSGKERVETREFPVSPGGTLVFDLDIGGSLVVEGWDQSKVAVTYEASGDVVDRMRVKFEELSDGVKISSDFDRPRGGGDAYLEFEIKVPREFNIELKSKGGGLEIDGVTGNFSGKTMGGALTLHDVRGEAELTTMGGRIRLSNSELDGYLKTYGGDVFFDDVIGDVKGSSLGGNVKYRNVVRRDGGTGSPARVGGADVNGETVQISTMGGAIEIDEAPEGASLHTMGGDIRVTDAQRFVSAKTMGGDVVLDAVDGWVKATTMGGDVEVVLVGDGGDVEITSMSGNVNLTIPAGFSAEFDVEIAYTKNSSQDFKIINNLGLQQSAKAEWDHDHGSPRKYIRAKGTTGGGEYKVKIRTINGDIRIK
jgi:DUF4097 and DUF4098 domain-containing protein YvlB